MISFEFLVSHIAGLHSQDLERWIDNQWVRPDGPAGAYEFEEVDAARIRLILELRDDLQVNEDALPVVLSLLDQVYDLRRRMRVLGSAIERVVPSETRRTLAELLTRPTSDQPGPG
jgi:chaperone modulatory protein CbpM